MADNTFDFTLRADDQASAVLQEISSQTKALQPELAKTQGGLALGGQQTEEGLSAFGAQFQNLSRLAKDNVQLFGDMVPPLKNVFALAEDFGGKASKFGAMGALTYGAVKGISAVGSALSEAAGDAYSLDVAARNAGMSVRDFSQLSGAMRLLGTDRHSAQSSVEGLYKTFNDAAQGRNSGVLAVMAQLNAPIARNDDGTADVLKTMEGLAAIFPKLTPQNQKTVSDALGLDANGLQLLREGARLKQLLTKADQVGLTVDPGTNAALSGLNSQLVEISASWDGLKNRTKQKLAGGLLSDGSVSDGLKGVSNLLQNPSDPVALNEALGNLRGNEGEWVRRAQKDKKFFDSLGAADQLGLITGQMNDRLHDELEKRYGQPSEPALVTPAPVVQPEAQTFAQPSLSSSANVNPRARSVRNNNPWNLRYAGQRGALPAGGNFAAFQAPEDGVLAADRQLQLYASGRSRAAGGIPLTTLRQIISVASPSNENNTSQMIRDAGRELNASPDQQLNLADTGERARVLHALFEREGNNPWSVAQIQQLITPAANPRQTGQPQLQEPLIAAQQSPADGSKPLITSQQAPVDTSQSLITPTQAPAQQSQQLSETLAGALKETGVKVELTLINDKTGDKKTFTGTGGKIATAMTYP